MKYYLDKNQIERMASNKDVYRSGVMLYTKGLVGELEFSQDGDSTRVIGSVSDGKLHPVVNVMFDGSGLLQKFSCSCDAFGVWRGGCEHVIAVFLKIFDHSREVAVVSRSLRVSRQLLEVFEKKALAEVDRALSARAEAVSPARLCPKLGLHYDKTPYITLGIGFDRMYVVKNISATLAAIEGEQVMSYGKNLEFKHSLGIFDGPSRALVRVLSSTLRQLDAARRAMGEGALKLSYKATPERYFSFTPMTLDAFFAIYEGAEIEAEKEDISKQGKLLLKTETPPLPLTLADGNTEGALSLSWEGGKDAVFFQGEAYGYIVWEGVMYRLSLDCYEALQPIHRAMSSIGGGRLTFTAEDRNNLAAFLLPALRRNDLVREECTLLAPEADAMLPRAYLDAENGGVTCAPAFVYGGVEARPGKHEEGRHIVRDIPGEYEFLKSLELMGFTPGGSGVYAMSGEDELYEFHSSENGLARLRELAEVFVSDAFAKVSKRPSKTPTVGLRLNGELLEIRLDAGDFTAAELLEALESYKLKKKYHRLSDGRFLDLEAGAGEDRAFGEALESLESLVSGLDISKKDIKNGVISIPKYRALYAGASLAGGEAYMDEGVTRIVKDFDTFRELSFILPATLEGILREYQKEGFKWLMTLARYGFGGILADDMGLGKTIQVIALLLAYKNETPAWDRLPSIVAAPTSLIYNWEKEINRFAPELSPVILSGSAERRKEDFIRYAGADVFITTYDMLKRDVVNYADTRFRFVVADEAQNIKNPGTQNAKSVKALKGDVRLALTGTPIENTLSELWSIFDFIMPGYLHSAPRFAKNYETPILRNGDREAAVRLKKQISPFILRRLKTDVLTELPEKVETTLYADMTPEQKKIYTAHFMKARGELEETVRTGRFNENRINILSMLTRLRQICCHPSAFIEDYAGGSGKLDLTVETVETSLESGHRLLIFSQFTRMLSIVMKNLDQAGVKYFYLDGATPSKERLEMAERFNAGERDAFLISLRAGGSGLNLTGADVVIHFDPWWNPAVMNQAADRAHRFGQSKTVQVINIVAKDSIEERIMALQARKKDLVDAVIEDGANFINALSQDEILELFNREKS